MIQVVLKIRGFGTDIALFMKALLTFDK